MAGVSIRRPVVDGRFYPGTESAVKADIERCLKEGPAVELPASAVTCGAIAPHAGWTFSGPTAAAAVRALSSGGTPETVVVFGAIHSWGVSRPSLYPSGSWQTPLGEISIDEELADAVAGSGKGIIAAPKAHSEEHSIEVLLPFVMAMYPETRILPIAMPPSKDSHALGRAVAAEGKKRGTRVVALGSTDLTHYGPSFYGWAPKGVGPEALKWVKEENDRRMVDLITGLREGEIVAESRKNQNACGAGAIAATVGFALEMGATRGVLLQYTTSYDVMGRGEPSDFVGYAAAALIRE